MRRRAGVGVDRRVLAPAHRQQQQQLAGTLSSEKRRCVRPRVRRRCASPDALGPWCLVYPVAAEGGAGGGGFRA
jgi:hypothetical protein